MRVARISAIAIFGTWAVVSAAQLQFSVQPILYNGQAVEERGLGPSGYVTGDYEDSNFVYHGVRWHNGAAELLDGASTAGTRDAIGWGINSFGVVAGEAGDANADPAALWDAQGYHNLGTLLGPNAACVEINDSGWITGTSDSPNGQTRGFLYRNGQMTDLGNLGISGAIYGSALDMNSSGLIVGWDQTGGESQLTYPWSWTEATGILRLPPNVVGLRVNDQ